MERETSVGTVAVETPQDKPAFDLLLEWRRVHEPWAPGENATAVRAVRKENFTHMARSYARECASIPVADYLPYRIVRTDDGVTLIPVGYDRPARELFDPDSADPNLPWPEWRLSGVNYRRAKKETEAIVALEKSDELWRATTGDRFLWNSPPCTGVLTDTYLDQQEKLDRLKDIGGFGLHTFSYVLTVDGDLLRTHVLRHYLHPRESHVLFQTMTGTSFVAESPSDEDFLGVIAKITVPFTSVATVKELIDALYDNTPAERKIIPPQEDQLFVAEGEMDKVLALAQPFLEHAFYLLELTRQSDLEDQRFCDLILGRFQAWEKLVTGIVEGDEEMMGRLSHLEGYDSLSHARDEIARLRKPKQRPLSTPETIVYDRELPRVDLQQLAAASLYADLERRRYRAVATMCGAGSAFGKGGISPFSLTPTYQSSMALLGLSSGEKESSGICCPECGWKPSGTEMEKMKAGELIRCPGSHPDGGSCNWDPCTKSRS